MWGDVSNCRVAFAHGVSVEDLPGLHGWRMTLKELEEALRGTPKALTFHYLTLRAGKDILQRFWEQRSSPECCGGAFAHVW